MRRKSTFNLKGKRQGGRDYLSYSALRLFATCPLRYYFKYVAGLPEETVAASLVFGSAVHQAVQHHFEQLLAGNPAPTLDTLLEVYQDAWRPYDDEPVLFAKGEDRNTLGRLADRLLLTFQESEFAHPVGKILGIEEELRGELIPGCPDLLGRVDLIVEEEDALVISDLKTSRSRWSQENIAESANQLLLYSELAKPLAGGKQFSLGFAVLTKTKSPELAIHPVEVNPHQVERAKLVVERVWRSIQAGNFFPNPSLLNCPSCPFREPCRGWRG